MDMDADIIPGHSIAGIRLGAEIVSILDEIQREGIAYTESTLEHFGRKYDLITVANDRLTIVADDTGRVLRLWCRTGYSGDYNRTFRPGMTVSEVRKKSIKQLVIHGFIVLDGEFGAAFSV